MSVLQPLTLPQLDELPLAWRGSTAALTVILNGELIEVGEVEASLAPFAVEDARSANGSTGGAIAAAQGELYELRVVLPSRDRLLTDLVRTCYSLGQPSRGSDWLVLLPFNA